jgi:hypothetical protein
MQGQDPSILRPSAWVVRTSKVTVTGKEEWIRLGFEDKDLPRLYNDKDVLEEVAIMYQTGVGVYVRFPPPTIKRHPTALTINRQTIEKWLGLARTRAGS